MGLAVFPWLTEHPAGRALVVSLIKELDQAHLFSQWALDSDEDKKKEMVLQLLQLDQQYPGGLKAYISNAKKLLKDAKNAEPPYKNFTPAVPQAVRFAFGSPEYQTAELKGKDAFRRSALVLVAG